MSDKVKHTKKNAKELLTNNNKKALIDAMQKSMGVVTEACKVANVSRSSFYLYYNSDPVFQKACDECEHIALDFAESQLYKQIKDGSTTATIFYLKTKATWIC